jgi:hypothetical protein
MVNTGHCCTWWRAFGLGLAVMAALSVLLLAPEKPTPRSSS